MPAENRQPATAGNFLLVASAFYLTLPWLIFAVGWLRDYAAVITSASLILPNFLLARRFLPLGQPGSAFAWLRKHAWLTASVLVLAILLVLLAGIGGIGYQTADWFKHNAILKELATQPWPAYVEVNGESLPLVYYFAFYLPAAVVGKATGSWALLNIAQALWALLGLGLAIGWFWVLVKRASIVAALAFVAFSGLDIVGVLLSVAWQPASQIASLFENAHIEWWAGEFQYSSNATLLFWAPQHAIGGWILAGSMMFLYSLPEFRKFFPFFLALSLFWSPLVALGLLIFAVADLWRTWSGWRISALDVAIYAASVWLLFLMLAFFATQLGSDLAAGSFALTLLDPRTASGQSLVLLLLIFVLFVLVEVGLSAWLAWQGAGKDFGPAERKLFYASLACLALLPFFRVGLFNDLAMRTSIPALFVLALYFTRALQSATLPKTLRLLAVLALLIGAVTPMVELKRQIERWVDGQGMVLEKQDLRSIEGVEALLETEDSQARSFYLGAADTWFFENLAQTR